MLNADTEYIMAYDMSQIVYKYEAPFVSIIQAHLHAASTSRTFAFPVVGVEVIWEISLQIVDELVNVSVGPFEYR